MTSESELITQLAQLAVKLDLSKGWEGRIKALKELHGLTLGGAAAYPAFLEELKTSLRDPLRSQLADRRSQVRGLLHDIPADL